ncbi:MAG: hypothetical protein K0R57_136 [Paenibacillaceae bacterium]|nr:hypothetical protein [Paenibacillaceae bacterium]
MNISNLDDEALIAFTQQVIRAQSLSGQEQEAAALIKAKMQELQFDEVWIDAYGSVIGKVNGTGEGTSILFDGHIDTVPVNSPEKWSHDPFGAELADGRMYGRGTTDMKAALCAAIFAVGRLVQEAKQAGRKPMGDIYISGTVFEEVFEGVALGKVMEAVQPDCVVIMESTALRVNIGQRGRAEINITAHGRSAHSANPDVGINAVYEINPVISGLMELEPTSHPQLGKGISVVTDIISSPYPGASVVPDLCRLTIDRRLLVYEDEELVLEQYRQLLYGKKNCTVEIAEAELVCYTGSRLGGRRFFPAWLMEADHALVRAAQTALQDLGQIPELSVYSFCTNGSYSAGVARVPTIGYGPSYEHIAHIADEYIELDQLLQAAKGYCAIAARVAGL